MRFVTAHVFSGEFGHVLEWDIAWGELHGAPLTGDPWRARTTQWS